MGADRTFNVGVLVWCELMRKDKRQRFELVFELFASCCAQWPGLAAAFLARERESVMKRRQTSGIRNRFLDCVCLKIFLFLLNSNQGTKSNANLKI